MVATQVGKVTSAIRVKLREQVHQSYSCGTGTKGFYRHLAIMGLFGFGKHAVLTTAELVATCDWTDLDVQIYGAGAAVIVLLSFVLYLYFTSGDNFRHICEEAFLLADVKKTGKVGCLGGDRCGYMYEYSYYSLSVVCV